MPKERRGPALARTSKQAAPPAPSPAEAAPRDAQEGAAASGPAVPNPDAPSPAAGPAGSPAAAGLAARRRRKGVLTALLSAVLLVAVGGGVVAAAEMLPGPTGERILDTPLADVPAGRATAVCAQPARLVEGTPVGTDPQFSPVSASAVSFLDGVVLSGKEGILPGSRITNLSGAGAAEISPVPSSTPTPVAGAPALKAAVVAQRPVTDTNVVAADALGNQQPSVAALMSYSATDGDLRGMAAAACQQPANDYWILGADTTLGRTAVLNLSNASGTPATVSLDLYGAKGQIQAAGSRGLLVPPGANRAVVLAGLAADQASLAVHLRSVGGPVAATIQQSTLRGLTAGGVDFLAPGAAPSARQVMTGVDIPDAGAIKALTAKSGFQDAAPALQIAVPGPADAVVQVKLFGSNGERALPGGGAVTAKGGSVTLVPLAGVPAGTYTVSATSDVAILASARVFKGSKAEDPTDFAWSPAAARLGSQHVVAVPQGVTAQLSFGAPDDRAKISLSPVTADGTVRKADTIDIAGGTTATVKIPAKVDGAAVTGYVVSASGDAVYGALVLGKDGRSDVAVASIQPGAAGQEKVPVILGY